jgi:plasmid stabilization system protein ParE
MPESGKPGNVEHRVIFSPEAAADLSNLYEYIAKRSGPDRAIGYIARIESYCAGFRFFPERGTKRMICGLACASSVSSGELRSRFTLTRKLSSLTVSSTEDAT